MGGGTPGWGTSYSTTGDGAGSQASTVAAIERRAAGDGRASTSRPHKTCSVLLLFMTLQEPCSTLLSFISLLPSHQSPGPALPIICCILLLPPKALVRKGFSWPSSVQNILFFTDQSRGCRTGGTLVSTAKAAQKRHESPPISKILRDTPACSPARVWTPACSPARLRTPPCSTTRLRTPPCSPTRLRTPLCSPRRLRMPPCSPARTLGRSFTWPRLQRQTPPCGRRGAGPWLSAASPPTPPPGRTAQ